MNQSAIIAGVFILLATVTGGLFTHFNRDRYPAIEIKNLTPTGEQVLARLALTPARQLLDSSAFAAIRQDDLIWNDSLGVAIAKPSSYEWGAGDFGELDDVSIDDVAMLRWFTDITHRGFKDDTARVRYFGVRLDQPTRITLTSDTKIDSTRIGTNPFRDARYFLGFMRMTYGDYVLKMPVDSLADAQQDAIRSLDSVVTASMPRERKIYNGVFIAQLSAATMPRFAFLDWLKRPLLAQAIEQISVGSPTVLIIDRDRGTVIFSEAVRIESAIVDGKVVGSVTLNRAGYAIQTGKTVEIVMLQYTSTESKEVLDELQRFLASVKLRSNTN